MRLPPERETVIARWVERIAEAWSRAAPIALRIDASSLSLVDRSAFLRSLGPAVCCGRSRFAGSRRGVGGWLLPHRAADRLACALGGLPPPPPHASATLGGPLDAGLGQLHELFLVAWNRTAPPEWRLSEEIGEWAVERFAALPPPRVAAEMPERVLAATIEVDGHFGEVGFLLPPELLGESVAGPVPAGPVAPLAPAAGSPIGIADPDGEVVRWLCAAARDGRIECVPTPAHPTDPARAATIVIGGAPGAPPVEVVTIRPRRG